MAGSCDRQYIHEVAQKAGGDLIALLSNGMQSSQLRLGAYLFTVGSIVPSLVHTGYTHPESDVRGGTSVDKFSS